MVDPGARPPAPPLDAGSWFGRHAAIATALAGGAFLLFKTYAVAHYSVTTTLGLLSTAPAAVLVGSIASFVYPLLPLVALGLGGWLFANLRRLPWVTATIAVSLFVVILLFSSWIYLVWIARFGIAGLSLAAGIFLGVGIVCAKRGWEPPAWFGFGPLVARGWILLTVALVIFATWRNADLVWLPAEVLTFESDPPTIGYVLAQEGGQTTFLRESDRKLIRVPGSPEASHVRYIPGLNAGSMQTSAVTGRHICHWLTPVPGDDGPLIEWLKGNPYESANLLCTRVLCHIYREDNEDGERDVPLVDEESVKKGIREVDPRCAAYGVSR